jgi:hypothetical protein
MSFLLKDKKLQKIVNDFHEKLDILDKNYPTNFVSCLKPSTVTCSVGM